MKVYLFIDKLQNGQLFKHYYVKINVDVEMKQLLTSLNFQKKNKCTEMD